MSKRSRHGRPRGPISTAWGVRGWPTIVGLDLAMKVHYRGHSGEEATAVARKLVDALAGAGK